MSSAQQDVCDVCQRPVERLRTQALFMCHLCGRSFDKMNRRSSTTAALVVWAVKRARYFERQKQRAVAAGGVR